MLEGAVRYNFYQFSILSTVLIGFERHHRRPFLELLAGLTTSINSSVSEGTFLRERARLALRDVYDDLSSLERGYFSR